MKNIISSYVREQHREWDKWISEFRYAINSAWQESMGFIPTEVALGKKLKGPLERLTQKQITPNMMHMRPLQGNSN